MPKDLVIAVSGASGAIYAKRFINLAAEKCDKIFLILSKQAIQVLNHELEISPAQSMESLAESLAPWLGRVHKNVHLLDPNSYFTPPASGSFRHDGMVIVPCSMGTLGRIANGISNDLMTRAADVTLKEGRKLILVTRETPLNLIMLRNMVQVAEAGAMVLPASPGWYHHPKTLDDIADTIVGRICQAVGIEAGSNRQWMLEE
jgi:4-hydroxy-3-polyprenylbenzoate decarboxylase